MDSSRSNSSGKLFVAATAAFCTYFCMYAFRKPFTATSYEGQQFFGLGLKTALVIAQIAGYMVSKFIGIKVISEMRSEYRAAAIVGLIVIAEVALVGFAFVPVPLKVVMLFLNGLPLGMIFGLVLSYLEGRQQTEALSAALCASFIMSSGVVKFVGNWLVNAGVNEFYMPMLTGLIFFPPLLVSVWFLQRTPPPNDVDRQLRNERTTMTRAQRQQFFKAYWPGLSLLVMVYVALTVIRTARDDFGVEIWRDMGVKEKPSIFATTETLVAILVTALNAVLIWITHNMTAIRITIGMMCAGFAVIGASAVAQAAGMVSPFVFMVACGVGMYVPYVAFHTTVFERLLAISKHPGNLGFLMYVADSIGYLGYVAVLAAGKKLGAPGVTLPFFHTSLIAASILSVAGLLTALAYFNRVLAKEKARLAAPESVVPIEELAAE